MLNSNFGGREIDRQTDTETDTRIYTQRDLPAHHPKLNSNLEERELDRQTDTETDTGIHRETFLHTMQCSTVTWEKETDRQTLRQIQAYTERPSCTPCNAQQ